MLRVRVIGTAIALSAECIAKYLGIIGAKQNPRIITTAPRKEYVKKLVETILFIASFETSSSPRLEASDLVMAPPKPRSKTDKYPMIWKRIT